MPPVETVQTALGLLRQGRPFSAHEVFEARWKAAPEQERDLWQGLAQVCVALTHAARGNAVGADRLLERGLGRVGRYAGGQGPSYGLDLTDFVTRARAGVDAGVWPEEGPEEAGRRPDRPIGREA